MPEKSPSISACAYRETVGCQQQGEVKYRGINLCYEHLETTVAFYRRLWGKAELVVLDGHGR